MTSEPFKFEVGYGVSGPLFGLDNVAGDNPQSPRYYLVTRSHDGAEVKAYEDQHATRFMTEDEIKDKALQLFRERDQTK